ncbi:Predicted L-lactate dehydrogenase, hypothetical protein subunit YkgG [hydrothermal vent metagenome]|uniref:LUD domain-containing protein n=1 Tax=hydrothermal vent metagenome TaxID=652676 RepID=A0A3B0TGC6_9ZZZZ
MSRPEKKSSARAAILERTRASLGVRAGDAARASIVAARLGNPARNTIPGRAKGDAKRLRSFFTAQLEKAQASVVGIPSLDALPGAVTEYLKLHNLPQALRMGDDEILAKADWSKAPHLERAFGPAAETDAVGLAATFAGIAETGTLMLVSGAANPTTNNFLPETHIVVVPGSRLLGSYEDGWDALRASRGKGAMPRTVNYVSGPSRTGDIEQKILLGAHGPRRLHVIIVDDI